MHYQVDEGVYHCGVVCASFAPSCATSRRPCPTFSRPTSPHWQLVTPRNGQIEETMAALSSRGAPSRRRNAVLRLQKRGRDDVWSMADDRLAQLAGHLTGTLSIAPMFVAAGSELVDHEPLASALRDARQNSQKTRASHSYFGSTLSTTGPIVDILRNTVQ